jgi:flagellar protein FliO/FliZ
VVELGLRVLLSLGVVLGLFWAVARMGARRAGGRDRTLLRVRSRQALSRGSSVAVVEVGSRVLVVGVSDAGVRLLTELDPFELDSEPTGLTEAAGEPPVGPRHGPLRAVRGASRPAAQGSTLGGSLLAPATWKQAWSAATARSHVDTHVSVPKGTE